MQFEGELLAWKKMEKKAKTKAQKYIGTSCVAHNIKMDKIIYIPFFNLFIPTCEKCREEIKNGKSLTVGKDQLAKE